MRKMPVWIPWMIAVVSTAACLGLWFRDVRRIMQERRNMVESAAGQLAACRRKAAGIPPGPEIDAILQRVENVYEQAVDRYNDTLSKPWVRLPAAVMGFCPIEPGKEA